MATLVAKVITPKSTWPQKKMGKEGGGTHDNRGVKEDADDDDDGCGRPR